VGRAEAKKPVQFGQISHLADTLDIYKTVNHLNGLLNISAQKITMQIPEEASGMCVDYCLFLPISSSQSNADSSPEPQNDAMCVLFNCSCTTPPSLPGPSGDLCTREVLLFYNLRFQNSFFPVSMGICQFCSSVTLKMHLCSNSCQETEGGRGCNCRWDQSQKSYSFFLLSLLYPDVQGTAELPQRRSDPSLRLP